METNTIARARRLLAAAPSRTAAGWDAVVAAWDRSAADNDHVDDGEFAAGWDAVRCARDLAKAGR